MHLWLALDAYNAWNGCFELHAFKLKAMLHQRVVLDSMPSCRQCSRQCFYFDTGFTAAATSRPFVWSAWCWPGLLGTCPSACPRGPTSACPRPALPSCRCQLSVRSSSCPCHAAQHLHLYRMITRVNGCASNCSRDDRTAHGPIGELLTQDMHQAALS